MKRCWIKIATPDGMERVSALDAGDGLAIHKTYQGEVWFNGFWSVTHIPTGLLIWNCQNRALAESIVEAIRSLCDWPTVPTTGPENRKVVRAAIDAALAGMTAKT